MKKNLVIALALVFVLGIAGTAFAAANPFTDVPAKHWAYDAVSKLAKAGILDGYGDGTYRGERTATRYEMAQATAKAMARADKADAQMKALIDKLAVEFAAELNNLGVRVAKLEKNASSIKFSGDARIRFQSNWNAALDAANNTAASRFDERVRVYATADVNDKTKFFGRLMANWSDVSTYGTSGESSVYWDYGYFQWTFEPGFKVAIGRQPLATSWSIFNANGGYDSIRFIFGAPSDNFSGSIAYGDLASYNSAAGNPVAFNGASRPVLSVDANYKINKKWTGNFGMYYSTNADKFTGYTVNYNTTTGIGKDFTLLNGYPFQTYTFGLKGLLAEDWGFTAQYLWNGASMPAGWNLADSKTGWVAELTYKAADFAKVGSWGLALNYRNIKPWTMDLNWVSGIFGNSSYGWHQIVYGVQGFGITANYTISKNAMLSFTYENMSTSNSNNQTLTGGTDLNNARYLPFYYLQMNVNF